MGLPRGIHRAAGAERVLGLGRCYGDEPVTRGAARSLSVCEGVSVSGLEVTGLVNFDELSVAEYAHRGGTVLILGEEVHRDHTTGCWRDCRGRDRRASARRGGREGRCRVDGRGRRRCEGWGRALGRRADEADGRTVPGHLHESRVTTDVEVVDSELDPLAVPRPVGVRDPAIRPITTREEPCVAAGVRARVEDDVSLDEVRIGRGRYGCRWGARACGRGRVGRRRGRAAAGGEPDAFDEHAVAHCGNLPDNQDVPADVALEVAGTGPMPERDPMGAAAAAQADVGVRALALTGGFDFPKVIVMRDGRVGRVGNRLGRCGCPPAERALVRDGHGRIVAIPDQPRNAAARFANSVEADPLVEPT